MVKRSARLLPVLKIAELEAEKAARALSYIQHKLQQEQNKLQQLEDYRHECLADRQRAGQAGISVQQWSIYDRFSQKVELAIEQQQQQIATITEQLAQIEAAWQRLDSRFRSLEKMLEKIRAEERHLQARQEQRNHDEFARRLPRKTW